MPQISVIVPVYKVEKYIHRCVDSVLGQTFKEFELILVDDGSPDNCGEICEEYAKSDSRIHVIHQKNGGLSAARNAGLDWMFANSSSEWVSFIDSDDWVHPRYLELLYKLALEQNRDVILGDYAVTRGESPSISSDVSEDVFNTEEYYINNIVNATVAWGKLYRRKCFNTLRYPVGKIHEDEYVTYKVLFQYEDICVLQQPLYAYYQNVNGIILSNWSTKKLDAVEGIEEQVDFFVKNNYGRAAEIRYISLIHILLQAKHEIKCSVSLTPAEKAKWLNYVKIKTRDLVKKYHKYGWITIKDKGFYLQAYGSVFPPFQMIRDIGVAIKKCRKGYKEA